MSFKTRFFRVINPLSKNFSFDQFPKLLPFESIILVYHLVSDNDVKHVKHLFPYRSLKQFEKDLDFLSKHFEFIDWDDFINKKKTSKPSVLLTFDDGYREFYDTISPILLRKGIFAINYINPKFIDNNEMMWRNKASLIVSGIIENKNFQDKMFEWTGNKSKDIISSILNINFKNQYQLDEIADHLEIDIKNYLKTNPVYLTAEQLQKLKNDGFGIASHGWDHPLYNQLSLIEQLENTQKSFEYMNENHFLIDSFAFPFTDHLVENQFFDSVFDQNSNLKFTFGAAGLKLDSNEKNIQRIPIEIRNYSVEEVLKNEIIYYQFLKNIKKNMIKRS
ncbi:peptidoglycan/xylan/chitin deacetylase (PgdA/CDA1 family) [Epilithonimonas hungarica]|uniref:polysaccharide deacetylase family protein n=1 Tax=Epilithonimonas hungarica TaxID=454006 RepID=UPI002787A766|nr:polysaccharide deacetylase family protein [Epilithonimonas hungarica]MDP9955556.1 peptidoglycan/xylan/chitin deacetylase (PgdA/CDA1 family) [Epilithonimonas hungarica]